MRFSLIPFLLLAVPLAEIAAFILVGGQIGVWATLGLVMFTAVLGSLMLRWQGLSLFKRVQDELTQERLPAQELVRGLMLLIAGILLLTPGFVTDAIGFALFVPSLQNAVWKLLKGRIALQTAGFGAMRRGSVHGKGDTVDLDPDDYTHRDDTTPWGQGSEHTDALSSQDERAD